MSPLLALVAFQAAPFDPSKDPLYAKPVTLHLPMATLRTVVETLSKQVGQAVSVSGAVDTWKATVLVKGLAAGRTMEALADALDLVWAHEGSSTILERAENTKTAASDYAKEERAQMERQGSGTATLRNTDVISRPVRRPGVLPGRRRNLPEVATSGSPVYVRFDPNLLATEVAGGQPPTRFQPALPTGESPWAKAAAAWPSVDPEVPPEWQKPFAAPALGKSPWESDGYALSDLLAAWHDATGLPVVADAFRAPMPQPGMGQGTGLQSLIALAGSNGLSLRFADGVARLRHPGFWRLREQEVPESAWSGLERSKTPTLLDLAQFASRLTVPQAAAFRSQEAPLSRVRTAAVRESYPALLLWSAMPGNVRQALIAGTPVGLAGFPNLGNAYLYALREAPYYQAGNPAPELALNAAKLGFFGATADSWLTLRLGDERGGGVSYRLPLTTTPIGTP